MQSRSVKRRLSNKDMPNRKRMKVSHDKIEYKSLYINDSDVVGILQLANVGDTTAKQIIKQRNVKPFESEDDLIKRIRGVTHKSIQNSNFKLVFVTQVTQQFNNIFASLINIKLLQQHSTDTIKIIAQFAVGEIKECGKANCNNEISILGGYEREKGWWTVSVAAELQCLAHPNHYTYYDRQNDTKFYMRIDRKYGDAFYCNGCTDMLRNCDACGKAVYFEDDRSTYNVCSGRHYKRGKLCLECTVCPLHNT